MDTRQVKSRDRVSKHGEVFTSEREVNAMLDLVKHETERIDSRFLEPACGDGNFLAEILRRKLDVVKKRYKKSPWDFEKHSVIAVSSVYGVDILQDNVEACRERLYAIWDKAYKAICKKETNEDCRKSVKFILARNVVCGNALSLKKVDKDGNDIDEPIVFSEWAFINGYKVQRSDYTFDKLLAGQEEPLNIFEGIKVPHVSECAVQLSMVPNSEFDTTEVAEQLSLMQGNEECRSHITNEGEFLKKRIVHYREVWKDGE